jgi:hypothetical protein
VSDYQKIFLAETDIRLPWRIAEFWEKAASAALSGLLAADGVHSGLLAAHVLDAQALETERVARVVGLAAALADQLVEEWRKRFAA